MWTDKGSNSKGHEDYPEVLEALQNALANLHGTWVAEATLAKISGTEMFYMLAADREVAWDDLDLGSGLSVTCAIRYGADGSEQEEEYDVAVTFQNDEGEDYKKELELIVAMLYALMEEDILPNARMAVYMRDLLKVADIQDYLVDLNCPAYIRSWGYQGSQR